MHGDVAHTSIAKIISEGTLALPTTLVNDFAIIVLLLCFGAFGSVYFSSPKKIPQLFSLVLRSGSLTIDEQDSFGFFKRTSLVLFLNYTTVLSLFVLFVYQQNHASSGSALEILLPFWGLFLGYIFLKRLLIFISGLIFTIPNEINEYLAYHSIYGLFCGIILLPVVVFLYFSSVDSWFMQLFFGFLLISMHLFRLIKSAYISIKGYRFRWYYFILYICTLEILPLAIGYQVLIGAR